MAAKAIARQHTSSQHRQPAVSASPLAEGIAQEGRFSRVGGTLSRYLDTAKEKSKDGKSPATYCQRAERVISAMAAEGIVTLTEDMVKSVPGGTSLMNNSYELRKAIARALGEDLAFTALDLLLAGAALENARWRNLADAVQVRNSKLNPVPTREERREDARKGDPYDPRPPVKIGICNTKGKTGFQTPDPYEGKHGLDAKILSKPPFPQAIALFGTYEQVPRFIKFELFPIAHKLASGKPEIMAALFLPEGIGSYSTRAAFYTDLKNALAARKEKIPSVKVAEKIVQKVLSDRKLGKMSDSEENGKVNNIITGRVGRLNVQKPQELPDQFLKSIPDPRERDTWEKLF